MDNQAEELPYAHLGDIDEKVFAGRRGFPLNSIGNVVSGEEITSINGESMVGFILEEDDNDLYVFMPALVETRTVGGQMGMICEPFGVSPVIRVNRRTVQDVCPIFYEKERAYYHFVANNVLEILPESYHPRLTKWIMHLTERVQDAKTACERSVYGREEEPEAGVSIPADQIPSHLREKIEEQMREEYGPDIEIRYASSTEEFEEMTGLEEDSLGLWDRTGTPPKKKIIH